MKNCIYEKEYTDKAIKCVRDESIRNKGCYISCPFYKKPWWVRLLKKVFG